MITAPWQVLHLDLSQGIPNLSADCAYQGIYLVFWWHDLPLGHIMISKDQLPLSSSQLTYQVAQSIIPTVQSRLFAEPTWQSLIDLKNPLETLQNPSLASNDVEKTLPTVSLVICTRDRPKQLEDCLKSLQNLAVAPHEVLVVDNAPKNQLTAQLVAQMPEIRYICEPHPGLSMARNTGIQHTTGDLIAFTDDDVRIHPNWMISLQSAFRNPHIMAVTGLILPGELETDSQVIFEMNHSSIHGEYQAKLFDDAFFARDQSFGVPVWRMGAGANMAFRRQILEKVGNFDERLGAGASGCSEDSEMWYRILAEGGICLYEPTAVVFHYHRRDMTDLNHQMYHYMRGHVTALLIQYDRYHHWGNLYRLFYDLPKHYFNVLMAGLFYGFGLKQKTLVSEVMGCLAGIFFYLRHRQTK